MEAKVVWKEKMKFDASSGQNVASMDTKSPIGEDTAMTPKEYLLSALCGCTAMDVISFMRKYKQPVQAFEVRVSAEKNNEHPIVFTKAHLIYALTGELDVEKVKEAVHLSKTKYCGVSAMLGKAFPISYQIDINGQTVVDSRE